MSIFITGILKSDLSKKYEFVEFRTERPTVGIVRDVSDYTLMFHIGFSCLVRSAISTMSHLLMFPITLIVNRPDLVHIHTSTYWSFWENAVYVLLSKLARRKTLLHVHGGHFEQFYERSNSFVRSLIRKSVELSDQVIVLSQIWKRFFAQLIPEDKIVVLENFVDSSSYSGFERKVDFRKDVIDVLFVGGVGAKTKGIYDVFRAIPFVIRECKNVCFVFVACNDIQRPAAIFDEVVLSHVKFLDYMHGDEKIQVFCSSDVFVLPSHFEGLPIAMLEAMAAGLPIVATSVGGVPEVIEDGTNGFLIQVGDYKALADRILVLARNKRLRWQMGVNNVNKIRERYDRTVFLDKLDTLYSDKFNGVN